MNGWWIGAFVALWLFVIALSLIVVGTFRRVADVMAVVEGAAAGAARTAALAIGSMVPPFSAVDALGSTIDERHLRGSASVVLFVSSDCPACRRLIEDIETGSVPEVAARIFVAGADPGDAFTFQPSTGMTVLAGEAAAALADAFRNDRLPQAFAVDERGGIVASGSPNDWAGVQALLEKGGAGRGEHASCGRFKAAGGRRWRSHLAAVVLATATAAVAGAPPAPAAGRSQRRVLDRTLSCAVSVKTTAPALDLSANVAHQPNAPSPASFVSVFTVVKRDAKGVFVPQVEFSSSHAGLRVDGSLCRPLSRRASLSSRGLTPQGTITRDLFASFHDRCITGRRVLVRARLEVSRAGIPVRGELAIRNDDARNAPVALVDWTPAWISYFLERDCVRITGGP